MDLLISSLSSPSVCSESDIDVRRKLREKDRLTCAATELACWRIWNHPLVVSYHLSMIHRDLIARVHAYGFTSIIEIVGREYDIIHVRSRFRRSDVTCLNANIVVSSHPQEGRRRFHDVHDLAPIHRVKRYQGGNQRHDPKQSELSNTTVLVAKDHR
jgi:hypothetical protein